MNEQQGHYVYVMFRPWNGVPCYVGKGKGYRHRDHERRCHNKHLANIFAKAGGRIPVIRTSAEMTDAEALELEQLVISVIGRKANGGPLVNLTDGGEGPCGLKHSEASKEKNRQAHILLYSDPAYRKKTSDATRAAMATSEVKKKTSDAQKRRFQDPIEREKNSTRQIGRKMPNEQKKKISKALKGKIRSPETRLKMSAWQIGRKMSEEAKRKMSDAANRRFSDPAQRASAAEKARLSARSKMGTFEVRKG